MKARNQLGPKKTAYDAFLKRHLKTDNVANDKMLTYTATELLDLIRDSVDVLKNEPMLATLNPPVVVVGDIHGQYYDLLRMFNIFDNGKGHGCTQMKYMFLGDYVDRGKRSLECICLVLLLKLVFPTKYVLLRGNHECKKINKVYGFYQELVSRFEQEEAEKLYNGFNDLFAWMPLAGLIGGKVLCMHGGISPLLKTLDDIRNIRRPLEDPTKFVLAMDLLWSDPMDNLEGYTNNKIRGISCFFGAKAVDVMCQKLGVSLIIRGHQVMSAGYGFFANRKLLTIFTAPRYQGEENNRGAVFCIYADGRSGIKTLSYSNDEPKLDTADTEDMDKSASMQKTHKSFMLPK